MERQDGEWELIGDTTLIQMEREVHQLARRLGVRPLRLEATHWSAPTLGDSLPSRWILGRSDIAGTKRKLQLLRDRVIDCWLADLPGLPPNGDPDLAVITLARMPIFFTCAPGHPLLKRNSIDYGDIAEFPTLPPPTGMLPLVERDLKSINLWNDDLRTTRYRTDQWEGKTEADLAIGYGTPLSMITSGGQLRRLPLLLPFEWGHALVFRKYFLGHRALDELRERLLFRLRSIASDHPEIQLVSA